MRSFVPSFASWQASQLPGTSSGTSTAATNGETPRENLSRRFHLSSSRTHEKVNGCTVLRRDYVKLAAAAAAAAVVRLIAAAAAAVPRAAFHSDLAIDYKLAMVS